MAPFDSYGRGLLFSAVDFSSHPHFSALMPSLYYNAPYTAAFRGKWFADSCCRPICSALMPSLHYSAPAPYTAAFGEKWVADTSVLCNLRTPILGSLIVILLSRSDILHLGSPPLRAWRLVHLLCGCFCIWLLREAARFSRGCARHQTLPSSSPSSVLLCCCKSLFFFQAHSGVLVILSLLAPLAISSEATACTCLCPHSCIYLPDTLSASSVKSISSISVSTVASSPGVFGAADDASDFRNEWTRSGWKRRSRSWPAESRVIVNRYFKCVQTLTTENSAANLVGSCSLNLSHRSTFNLPSYIGSCSSQKSGRFSRTCRGPRCCQRMSSQSLLQRKAPPTCTPTGRLSSVCAVAGGSRSSLYPYNLGTLQPAAYVERSSCSATLVPPVKPSRVSSRANGSARAGLPYVCLLSCGAFDTQDAHRRRVAFRTPHGNTVACSSTAESRAQALLEDIKKLTIVEVSELVNLIEQSFGVAAVRAAAADLGEGNKAQEDGTEKEEGAEQPTREKKTAFSVEIKSVPLEKRIGVIKTLRTVRPDLGLKDAKGVIDALPSTVLSNVSKEKAEEARKILADAGAEVEIK